MDTVLSLRKKDSENLWWRTYGGDPGHDALFVMIKISDLDVGEKEPC